MAIYDKWISLGRVVTIEVGKDKSLIGWFSVRLLLVCLISVPVNLRAAAVPLHPCDTLAANPNDTQAVSEGIRTSIYLAVSQEYKEAAVRACQHAIEQYPDEARFQYQYGRMLLQSDQGRAMEWMERAADQNYLAAQYTVGKFRLIKKNYVAAYDVLQSAADAGSALAQRTLAYMYKKGRGLSQPDPNKALYWYQQAAEQGNARAQVYLGDMYYKGFAGSEPNYLKAFDWYKKAALQSYPSGQYKLGVLYFQGNGMPNPDLSKAVTWFARAAAHGNKRGREYLDIVLEQRPDLSSWAYSQVEADRQQFQDLVARAERKIEKIDLKQATKSVSEAQESVAWKKIVADAIQETLSGLNPGDVVFVVRSSTTAKEGSYFPFFESIQAVIESSTVESGFNIPIEQPLESGYYVETDFEVENSGVSMTPRVQEAKNGKVVATKTIGLSATELPKSWSDRNLQDIAHELTKKLTRSRFLAFRKNVPVVFGEIVGGKLSDPSHVTDFSILMRGYIEDEISKLVRIRLVGEDSKKKTHSLKGVYHVIDSNVELRLTLRNLKSGSAKANAASSFSRKVVPAGVSVLP